MSKQMKEIKGLTKTELTKRMRDVEAQLFQTRMQKATGQLENTAMMWKQRKELARLKTELTAKARKEG